MKPSRLWDPSHIGFFAEWPQRHRKTFVPSFTTVPPLFSTAQTPSTSRGPFSRAVIFYLSAWISCLWLFFIAA